MEDEKKINLKKKKLDQETVNSETSSAKVVDKNVETMAKNQNFHLIFENFVRQTEQFRLTELI